MIKLFRAIRQQQFTRNKFSKYFLYIISEILLIVIGILIALYINNLNFERNLRITELEILEEIKSNLETNVTIFQQSVATEEDYLSSNQMILDYLDNKKPYKEELSDAFATYFWTVSVSPINSGFEYLKAKGLDIISNSELRKEISYLFDNNFNLLKQENQLWDNNLQQSVSYPYHVDLFRSQVSQDLTTAKAFPNDYEALFHDNKFKSINSEIIINRLWNINSYKTVIDKMEHLITSITNETEKLSL